MYDQADPSGVITALVFLAVIGSFCLSCYFLPVIVAYRRRMAQRGFLLVLNLLVGWTGVIWAVCLAWAIMGETDDDLRIKQYQLSQGRQLPTL